MCDMQQIFDKYIKVIVEQCTIVTNVSMINKMPSCFRSINTEKNGNIEQITLFHL